MSFGCTDKDTLVAYLYGECDEATGRTVAAHIERCEVCAGEVRGFASVRETLAHWAPPDRVGSYRLVRDESVGTAVPATVLRPARWWQAPLPAMARVAAGILLFAGGAALANLDVTYDSRGFAVRTGWRAPASAPSAAARPVAATGGQTVPGTVPGAVTPAVTPAAAPATVQADTPWRGDLAALERSLRDELHQQLVAARASGGAAPMRVSTDAGAGEDRVMAQVRQLIDESYRRQQVEVAYRINQMEREFQGQRKADLVKYQPSFGQLDGPPIYLPEQRQMMNYIRLNPVTLKK
jgi:hypothetical protein